MDQNNIPIKYTMGIWKALPNYPSKLDILYEVVSFLDKNAKTEFSEQTLNGLWFDSSGSGNWKGTKTEAFVNELISDGTFKLSKEAGGKNWYEINKRRNPFAGHFVP